MAVFHRPPTAWDATDGSSCARIAGLCLGRQLCLDDVSGGRLRRLTAMRMGEAAEVSADGEGSPSSASLGSQGFVHLRVRSAYSLLEGAIKADKIVALAKGCD